MPRSTVQDYHSSQNRLSHHPVDTGYLRLCVHIFCLYAGSSYLARFHIPAFLRQLAGCMMPSHYFLVPLILGHGAHGGPSACNRSERPQGELRANAKGNEVHVAPKMNGISSEMLHACTGDRINVLSFPGHRTGTMMLAT